MLLVNGARIYELPKTSFSCQYNKWQYAWMISINNEKYIILYWIRLMNSAQNDNKMHADRQQLMVFAPEFFWEVSITIQNVSAPNKLSKCSQSSGDHRDHADAKFFIQWPLWSHKLRKKVFEQLKLVLWHYLKSVWCELEKQLWIYHFFFAKTQQTTWLCPSLFPFTINTRTMRSGIIYYFCTWYKLFHRLKTKFMILFY